ECTTVRRTFTPHTLKAREKSSSQNLQKPPSRSLPLPFSLSLFVSTQSLVVSTLDPPSRRSSCLT
ncbi:hypothetical protein Taro_055421, partial [Colocasia esculenta]|nr:hypothetical protein [Colocasia esculenta]